MLAGCEAELAPFRAPARSTSRRLQHFAADALGRLLQDRMTGVARPRNVKEKQSICVGYYCLRLAVMLRWDESLHAETIGAMDSAAEEIATIFHR